MKCVQATLLPGICRPCLTAIQQDAEDTGVVHMNPCVQHECTVFPPSIGQSGHGRRSFTNVLISTSVDRLLVMVEPK